MAQGPISGFMPGRGNTDFALSYAKESYDEYFFGSEKQDLENTIQSASLFIEHGFTDTLSMVLSVPYIWIDTLNQGFQDAVVAIKYLNQRKRYNKSALSLITSIGISFPLTRYPITTDTPIGVRATTFQGRFLGQVQFDVGAFLQFQTGIDFRLIPTAQSSLPFLIRTGFGAKRLYADLWMEFYHTFNSGIDEQIAGGTGSNWTKIGGTVYYAIIPKFGVFLAGSQFLSGRNVGFASRYSVGLVYQMGKNR